MVSAMTKILYRKTYTALEETKREAGSMYRGERDKGLCRAVQCRSVLLLGQSCWLWYKMCPTKTFYTSLLLKIITFL